MDFNYDLGKSLGKEIKIRKIDEKPEEEVLKETAKADEPSENLRIPTRRKITADSTAINAFINRALMDGQNNKPEATEKEPVKRKTDDESNSSNNIFIPASNSIKDMVIEETANNIFADVDNANAVEKETGIDRAGEDRSPGYHLLVELWCHNAANADYETKMGKIADIIAAAENEGLTTEAATWRCYRFILRNNYLKEKYNNYLQQLANGVSYEDLGWNEQPWEINPYMNPGDQEDWNVFYHQEHMGGEYIQLIENEPAYEYIPAEPEQAYVYCCAMIARYSTIILAIQVKLHDPDVINYPNPNNNPENVLVWKLNKDIAYYRQLLQGMIAERNRLAVELNYATQDENGAIHFNATFPNNNDDDDELTTMFGGLPMVGGLVPGLTVPEEEITFWDPDDMQGQFETLQAQYFEIYGNPPQITNSQDQKARTLELAHFADKMKSKEGIENPEYWNEMSQYWNNILSQLPS